MPTSGADSRIEPPVKDAYGPAPGLKVAALVAMAVGALLATSWWVLGSLLAMPVVWWFAHGKSLWRLLSLLRRAAFLLTMLMISFVLVPPQTDTPWLVEVFGQTINLSGLAPGGRMAMRILVIIVASIAIRDTGRPREFLVGLRQVRLPLPIAQTVAATLALLGDGPARRGRRKGKKQGAGADERQGLRDLMRSGKDVLADKLAASLSEQMVRSQAEIEGKDGTPGTGTVADAAIVTSLVVMAMTVKFVKILPGLPFASGHKLVVIIPLYMASAHLTRARFGATWMGTTLGFVAFSFGEGRFGLLEVVKYVGAGLVVDLAWPLLRRRPNVILLGVTGLLMGVTWLGGTLLAGWIARAPAIFFALALGTAIPQMIFATVGGTISWALVRVLDRAPGEIGHTSDGDGRQHAAATESDVAQHERSIDDG